MDTSKIIKGAVSNGRYTVTAPIVKEDYGLYLQIEGVELPQTYEVDFSNSEHNGTSVTMIGNSDGVLIPHQFIDTGKDIFAFLYHVGEDYGRTVYKFRIPNKVRPDRTEDTPTPEEQSTIDQAISALNEAVAQTAQDVIDADASAQSASADADRAEQAKEDASTFAQRSANSAQASADYSSSAQTSATASANSASASAQIKADVEDLMDDAQGYAQASERSASASANSASQASASATSASQSATSAQGYASQAQTSAQTASTKASEASTSASTANTKASESAQSASQALTYKTDAESAKTASQTAQGLAESARDTAVSAKTDAESARDDAVQAKEDAESAVASISDALDDKAPVITDTASGAIASFSDGADDLPLKSLVVDINPVQDLHGQDAPYPAGGGKNKLPTIDATQTINGVTWTLNPDGSIKLTGTATANSVYDFGRNVVTLPSGTYTTLDITVSGIYSVTIFKIVNGTASVVKSGGGVFTLSEETSIFIRYVVSTGTTVNTTIYPQAESGSTATSYAPYENICPISGWTGVQTNQSGVNVWDEEWEVGAISSDTGENSPVTTLIRTKGYISIKPNTSYYNYFGNSAGGINFQARFYDENKNYIGYISASGTSVIKNRDFITPVNAHYLRFQVQAQYGTTYNHDISINHPSTDHSYHPYTGRSITIDLGQTVYGAKLYPLEGKAVVDKKLVIFNGTEAWSKYITGYNAYRIIIPDAKIDGIPAEQLRSNMSVGAPTRGWSAGHIQVYASPSDTTYVFLPSSITDRAEWLAWLADNNVQLTYPIATPLTIQLTPNQVNSLLGVNNIWADSGDTEVEYRADTKAWVQRKIAEALASLT